MHAKHVVVVVASANMDVRSKELNEENVLGPRILERVSMLLEKQF
jgi:hypothetical protein